VPKTLVIDNLKAAVTKADWFDPDLNPKIQAFCEHYGTVSCPSRQHSQIKPMLQRAEARSTNFAHGINSPKAGVSPLSHMIGASDRGGAFGFFHSSPP
jgi:hypothetical protein